MCSATRGGASARLHPMTPGNFPPPETDRAPPRRHLVLTSPSLFPFFSRVQTAYASVHPNQLHLPNRSPSPISFHTALLTPLCASALRDRPSPCRRPRILVPSPSTSRSALTPPGETRNPNPANQPVCVDPAPFASSVASFVLQGAVTPLESEP